MYIGSILRSPARHYVLLGCIQWCYFMICKALRLPITFYAWMWCMQHIVNGWFIIINRMRGWQFEKYILSIFKSRNTLKEKSAPRWQQFQICRSGVKINPHYFISLLHLHLLCKKRLLSARLDQERSLFLFPLFFLCLFIILHHSWCASKNKETKK